MGDCTLAYDYCPLFHDYCPLFHPPRINPDFRALIYYTIYIKKGIESILIK
jgi:hypothetical protein